jgi:hypothetical protein
MPTYPQASPAISVQALLKQPQRISRDLANMVYQRLITPKLFVRGTKEQVAGGAMWYQLAESIFLDTLPGDVEEIATRGDWPRAGWTEQLKTTPVKQYGLEVPLSNLAIRRNAMDQVTRAERKLANNIVRFVDGAAIAQLVADPGITTQASAAAWNIASTDIIVEVAKAQQSIESKNNGYNGFTGAVLVLNIARRDALLNNTVLRAALPRENFGTDNQIKTGMLAPFLGLGAIEFTTSIAANQALILDPTVAGTIAFEEPDPAEGFVGYDPGAGFAPIYVKVYAENRPKDTIIAGGVWPALALTDPGAVTLITGV